MNTTPLLELLSLIALKGAVVLSVALLLGLGLRRMAAARRHALWITAIATLAVLPLAMWALPAWHVLPQADAARDWPVMAPPLIIDNASSFLPPEDDGSGWQVSKPALPVPAEAPARPVFSWNISWHDVVESLPMVWMLIAGLLLLRLGHSAWRLHRLEASLRPEECVLVPQTARELGLQRMPRLLIGPGDSVPMVWGVLRPRLLLPQGFETWSPEKQRGVLLHELAHLKRGDPLALWAAQWVKALHWFNPLVWLTFRQLRVDQERACDDAVLRHGVRASDYAQYLLDLSRHSRVAPGLSLCALTITRCAPVEARVKAILDPKRSRESLTLRWLLALAGGALLITLPVAMLHAIEDFMPRGRILDRHGVVLAESTKEKARQYPLKSLAAHVVGYTRMPDSDDARLHGGAGVEQKEDASLKTGNDVSLTLDARIQALTLQTMKDGNVKRGAAVVLDPRTGEILASVSLPGYDPNLFVPFVSFQNWDRYLKDIDTPLLDRVSSARSAPGAVLQPFTALAALRAGKTPGTYACTPLTRGSGGGVRYGSVTRICRTSLREGAAHGPLTLEQALAKGCSSYFFQLGTEVGYPALFSMAEDLGLQQGTNIFGVKSPPLLPTMEELSKTRSSQRQLNDITTDFASGRGSPATVLQMAALYSALANGKVWEPSLTKKSAGGPRLDLNTLPDLPEGLARVRSALREAVIHPQPWARALTSSKAQIAALADSYATGAKGPHSEVFTHHYWMAGYAPADKPALAFALYVDETSPDSTLVPDKLGPMVRRVVEETLALSADGSGEVKPVEEKSGTAPTTFDFNGAEISQEIKLLEAELKISFKEFKIGNGQVTIIGDASEIVDALKLRKRLEEIGEKRQIGWYFPLPKSVENDRVGFRASGVYQPSPSNTEEGSKKAEVARQSLRSFKKTTAKVIGRSSGSLVINRGSLDGIVANSPVITPVGLVGKTDTPEPYFTKVILLTDELCRVSAKVEGTQEQGILNGEKVVRDVSPQLHLRFLSRQAKIDIGSRVSSSGEGGVFPAGLYLGRVKQFKTGDISGEAVVEPAVDFSTLDQVFVIEQKTESPAQEAPTPPKPADKAQLRQQSDAAIRMKPALAKQWAALKRAGLLADLPARARPFDLGDKHPERQVKSVPEFQFWTSRVDVRRWLVVSHCSPAKADPLASRPSLLWEPPAAAEDIAADWPAPPEPFQRTYATAGHCEVHIHASDGENVTVTVRQRRPSILIAPDESQEPQPAGRLAPEYHGKSFTQSEAMPTLKEVLQTLRPTITPQEVQLPTFRPQPVQYRVQAPAPPSAPILEMPFPLNRLHGELSAESERALRSSLESGSRMRQTLWVRAPQH